MPFPYIHFQQTGSNTRASAGLALRSISKVEVNRDGENVADLEWLRLYHLRHVRFVQILSHSRIRWILELHMISWPSFDTCLQGRVQIALNLNALGHSRAEATEACLSQVIILEGMLHTFWEHTEFQPILSGDEYAAFFAPFEPEACLRIHRKSRSMSLAHPFEAKTRSSLGFSPSVEPEIQTETPSCVHHVFPWIAPFDDWSMLLQALLRYPTPQHVVVRLSGNACAEESIARLESTISTCEQFLASAPADQVTLTGKVHMIRDASLRPKFFAGVIKACHGKRKDS